MTIHFMYVITCLACLVFKYLPIVSFGLRHVLFECSIFTDTNLHKTLNQSASFKRFVLKEMLSIFRWKTVKGSVQDHGGYSFVNTALYCVA